jgi:hypothetical protein
MSQPVVFVSKLVNGATAGSAAAFKSFNFNWRQKAASHFMFAKIFSNGKIYGLAQ